MVELTLNALQAESAAERWQAIEKLNSSRMKSAESSTLDLLLKALADEHPFVRWQAGLALTKHGEGEQRLSEALRKALAKTSPRSSLIRLAAADALATSVSPAGFTSLVDALRSDDALLRQSAAEALANQKNSDAIPHLVKVIQDPDPWVRRAAIYALGHLGNPDTAHTIIAGLRDQAILVRRSAAYALGALRAELAVPQLKISLTDNDPLTRRNAAWALGRIGLDDALPDLTKLSNDAALDGTVAATAQQAVRAITKPRWLQSLLGLFKRT